MRKLSPLVAAALHLSLLAICLARVGAADEHHIGEALQLLGKQRDAARKPDGDAVVPKKVINDLAGKKKTWHQKIFSDHEYDYPQGTSTFRNYRDIDVNRSDEDPHRNITPANNSMSEAALPNYYRDEGGGSSINSISIGDGICHSFDIRNDLNQFKHLKDCRVIEGFLQIVLLEWKVEEDFQNLTFPELREISGYLLLYRVSGLKSIGHLFPNLEIIRGDVLLTDYAFMVYEMQNLQEIGLTKLSQISRGGVRIEYNPSLCYTTLDWNAIVVAGETFIKENRVESSCPGCPQCPNGHCWTSQHCQEFPEPKCHPLCLGECFGPKESDCFVCRNFRHEGKCVEGCPPHLYSYLSRRCITKEECLYVNNLPDDSWKDEYSSYHYWRPFNHSCISHCPLGYQDDGESYNMTCRLCDGPCRKELPGALIRHMADIQRFQGTTLVNGNLEIKISSSSSNMINELTQAFSVLEEVTGYVKITHSFPLTNLYFLKNLKAIGGEQLSINNSSLVVIDNPNLSDLFPSNQQLKVLNGRFFFHYNPKLCLWKIKDLGMKVGVLNITDIEVQPISNGDKVACNVVGLSITVQETGPNFANISWSSYIPRDGQQLISYLLNYIETNNENITYESNACGNITWQTVDVGIPKRSEEGLPQVVETIIVGLKPYTKYAAFVKTLSALDDKSWSSPVGQSEIIFFQTKNDRPSVPQDVYSFAVSDSEIVVKWSPPEHPNGPIGNYLVSGFLRPYDEELPLLRDYCVYDLVDEPDIPAIIPDITEKPAYPDPSSCCSKDHNEPSKTLNPNTFEIFCHEDVTINYLNAGRKNYCVSDKYSVVETDFFDLVDTGPYSRGMTAMDKKMQDSSREVLDDTKTRMYNGVYYSFIFNVSAESNEFILTKLKHYSLYTISVAVCSPKLNESRSMCSPIQYTSSRTKANANADEVHNVMTHVYNSTIAVSWEPVKEPNGLTVAYTVEYTNLNVKDAKKSTDCIPHVQGRHQTAPFKHYIRNLSSGKYSLRVRSKSLAGDGNYTDMVYFTIGLNKDSNTITVALLLCFVISTIVAVAMYLGYQYRRKKALQERLIAVNPDYVSKQYVPDMWEVPRESIELLDELGLGNFGMVYRGLFNGSVQVAVKTISETASEYQRNEFLNEASVMKNFSTFHIIKLLGVVSDGNPPYVIMELMENGDLKTYLRRLRDSNLSPDASRLVRMAAEIADGMAYLESKKFVHRDLAARNCMVSKDLVCKIGDFGMARDIYETDYYKVGQKGLLPIRWMAPENLSDGVFTSDSDVWSYGVVLYEIIMLGELPYQGLSNEEVIRHVLHKGKLNILVDCPEILSKIMEKCMKWRPHDRPTFMEIVSEFEPFLGQDFCERSFYHSEEAVALRQLGIKKAYHQPAVIRFNWGNETARWVKEFEDNASLLDQTKATTSRGRIFKNGFQQLGNLDEVVLDR